MPSKMLQSINLLSDMRLSAAYYKKYVIDKFTYIVLFAYIHTLDTSNSGYGNLNVTMVCVVRYR